MTEYKYHWMKREAERKNNAKETKPKKGLKRRTKQGAKDDRTYSKMRLVFLEAHPVCQCGHVGCTGFSSEIHHKKGRGIWLLITSTWIAVCDSCHKWIEAKPEEAKAAGFSVDRVESGENLQDHKRFGKA